MTLSTRLLLLPPLLCLVLAAGCARWQTPTAREPGEIVYSVAAPGLVSLAVYDAAGQLVRTLASGVEQAAGTHRADWDGRDQLGQPLPAGRYEWRVLVTPGFTARYLGPVGINPRADRFHDYWFGNHAGPATVAAGAGVLVMSAAAENVPATLCLDLASEEILWTHGYSSHPMLLQARVVADRLITYAADTWHKTAELLVLEVRTGRELKKFSILRERDKGKWSCLDYRLATDGKLVAVAYPAENLIQIYDIETGQVTRELTHEAVVDVAWAEGRWHVLAAGGVWREEGGVFVPVISADQLVAPHRLAVDAVRREWLVAEAVEGGRGGQVKRFDFAGNLRAVYGRAGGRRDGPWSAADFQEIRALTALGDDSGQFVVGEGNGSVSRVVRLDAEGRVLREWFGPQQFYNFAAPDPGDPTRIVLVGGYRNKSIARVDLTSGRWEMLESYSHPDFGDGLFPSGQSHYIRWWPQRRHGQLYLVSDAGHAGIVRVDAVGGRLVPVAAAGPAPVDHPLIRAARERQGLAPGQAQQFVWTDQNGDGEIEAAEITLTTQPLPTGVLHIDGDWNVYWRPQYWHRDEAGQPAWTVLPNTGAATASIPTWDPTRSMPAVAALPATAAGLTPAGSAALARGPDGSYYFLMNGNRAGGDRHGAQWPTMVIGSARLIKWWPDGRHAWTVGGAAVDAAFQPSLFHEPVGLPGFIRGNVVVADKSFGPATVFTSDGLYAGSLLDHRAADGLPDRAYVWWRDPRTEMDSPIPYDCKQGGSVFEHGGRVYWMPMGNQYTPLYEITGWTGWQRQTGFVTAPPPSANTGRGVGLRGRVVRGDRLDAPAAGVPIETPRLWCVSKPANRAVGQVDWSQGPAPGIDTNEAFTIEWRGQLEAKFTEPCRLSVYNHDSLHATHGPGWNWRWGRARVWLGGELVVDTDAQRTTSRPVRLRAGARYDLRVEYHHSGRSAPEFSLCWDMPSQERQRVPGAFLHPLVDESGPTLALTATTSTNRQGATEAMIRLEASAPPRENLIVELSRLGDPAAGPAGPAAVTLRAGQTTAEFRVPLPMANAAARYFGWTLNPVPGWRLCPERVAAEILVPARSDLFPFRDGDAVVLADDLTDPSAWGNIRATARFAAGVVGPVVESNDQGFQVWRSLPTAVDLRRHTVVIYLRARTPGGDYGGHVAAMLGAHWLGLRVFGAAGAGLIAHRARDGHFGGATLWRGQPPAADVPGWQNYRLEVRLVKGAPEGQLAVLSPEGVWVDRGGRARFDGDRPDLGEFLVPPPLQRLELTGRNRTAGFIDAVAVAVRPVAGGDQESPAE